MESPNFKTNFIGKDGFVWWIGQIAPEENWIENFGNNEKAWGMRYKVRIMGYHPYSNAELPDKDLPWAQVLTAPGNSGSQNTAETVRLAQGDVVVGFFLDGHNAQVPMIMGSFANTPQWDDLKEKWGESGAPASPFGVFGGYSKAMPKENYAINTGSSNDNTSSSAETNVDIDRKTAEETGKQTVTSTTGKEVNLCNKGPVAGIKDDVNDLVDRIQGFKANIDEDIEFYRDKVKDEIGKFTESICRKSNQVSSGMIDGAYDEITPLAQTGLKNLYSDVESKVTAATQNPKIGHVAGVAAQTSMVNPLNSAEKLIGCLANNIKADMCGMVEDILNSMVDNVFNVTDCVSDQVVGAITNGIIGKVGEGMSGALGGLDKILGYFGDDGGFNIENILRQTENTIAKDLGLQGCNEPTPRADLGPCRYKLGYGPVSSNDADLKNIMKNANAADAVAKAARLTGFPLDGIQDIAGALDIFNSDMKVPGFKSAISDCYSGLPTLCEPPKIRIFGGGGSGAEATPIFGSIVGDTRYRTGSIIDIKLTNPGNNYTFPPFVEVVDNCNQGYGAQARSILKDGKVVKIYMVSIGENYPVSDQSEVVIVNVNIINPGRNYQDGDSVTDNFGNEYDITIQNGAITKVKPLTSIAVDELPELTINSSTGFGAIINPEIDIRPDDDGEVKQVIDCIT